MCQPLGEHGGSCGGAPNGAARVSDSGVASADPSSVGNGTGPVTTRGLRDGFPSAYPWVGAGACSSGRRFALLRCPASVPQPSDAFREARFSARRARLSRYACVRSCVLPYFFCAACAVTPSA